MYFNCRLVARDNRSTCFLAILALAAFLLVGATVTEANSGNAWGRDKDSDSKDDSGSSPGNGNAWGQQKNSDKEEDDYSDDEEVSEEDTSEWSDTVTISFERPETRQDGSVLMASEIDRYEVFYGATSGDYEESFDTLNTSTEVASLDQGTYYFAVKVYDTDGLASEFSEEVSTIVE